MNLGEVREGVESTKLFGAVPITRMSDSRKVVIQTAVGESDYGLIYEYREVNAIGTLFFNGEFTVVIAAGDKV